MTNAPKPPRNAVMEGTTSPSWSGPPTE
jgi:hypothetical protein